MMKKILLILSSSFVLSASAIEHEDFVRIAKSAMAENKNVVDSTSIWHGAGFVSVSSRGITQPNALVRYQKGKWQMEGDLTMDIGKANTDINELGNKKDGSYFNIGIGALSSYSKEKLDLKFKYSPKKSDVLMFSVFQIYNHDKTASNTESDNYSANSELTGKKIEDKDIKTNDVNFGLMTEYKHLFHKGGSIAARVYFKYDNNPTDVDYRLWSENKSTDASSTSSLVPSLTYETQHYHSADPKMQVVYLSPTWKGFSFGVREKLALLRTSVDNETSYVNFNTTSSFSSGEMGYKAGRTALRAFVSFEYYDQHLKLVDVFNKNDIYDDWQFGGSITQGIGKYHQLKLSYQDLITRPTYMQLYPLYHVGTSGLSTHVKGNPNLYPSDKKTVSLSYTMKYPTWKIVSNVEYGHLTNEISKIYVKHPNSDAYYTWENDATKNTLKLELNGEVKKGCFDMTCGAHVTYTSYVGEAVIDYNSWSFSFKVCPEVRLPKNWSMYLVTVYTGREKNQYYETKDYIYTAFGARKVIGPWILYGLIQDISEGNHDITYYFETYTNAMSCNYHSRAAILGVSYQF